MVNLKLFDEVAQRPDSKVEYVLKSDDGWPLVEPVMERYRPSHEGITLPEMTATVSSDAVTITVRASKGVQGAKYRVAVGDEVWFLTVDYYCPCRPVKGQAVTRHLIHEGHVWIADKPTSLGTGREELIVQPVRSRRR
jgi:hypothetical protein